MRERTVVRCSLYILFTVICLTQCFSIMSNFLRYPPMIDIRENSSDIAENLPGLTICNNNRLSLRQVMLRYPDVAQAIHKRFPYKDHYEIFKGDEIKFTEYRDELDKIFRLFNLTMEKEVGDSTLNETFSLLPDMRKFITYIGCAQTASNPIDCAKITRIEFIQDRKCVTLLHRGAMTHDNYVNESSLIAHEDLNGIGLNGSFSFYLPSKDLVRMIINLDPADYGDLKRQIGARLVIHSNRRVGFGSDLDFFITRGNSYDFNVEREDMMHIGPPHGDCQPEYERNLDLYKRYTLNPRVEIDSMTCLQNCVTRNIIKRFDCWPLAFPYFRNDTLDPDLDLKACNTSNYGLVHWIHNQMARNDYRYQQMKASGAFVGSTSRGSQVRELSEAEREVLKSAGAKQRASSFARAMQARIRYSCLEHCGSSCRESEYSISVSRSDWPSHMRHKLSPTDRTQELRFCCASVTVRYAHYHRKVHKYKPKYQFVDTLGDIGGLLAVWLGLSIISIYKAIQRLGELFQENQNGGVWQRWSSAFQTQVLSKLRQSVRRLSTASSSYSCAEPTPPRNPIKDTLESCAH